MNRRKFIRSTFALALSLGIPSVLLRETPPVSKFGDKSMHFTGVDDYLDTFDLSGDFSIEVWNHNGVYTHEVATRCDGVVKTYRNGEVVPTENSPFTV